MQDALLFNSVVATLRLPILVRFSLIGLAWGGMFAGWRVSYVLGVCFCFCF